MGMINLLPIFEDQKTPYDPRSSHLTVVETPSGSVVPNPNTTILAANSSYAAPVPYPALLEGKIIAIDDGLYFEDIASVFTLAFKEYLSLDLLTLLSVLDEPILSDGMDTPDFFNLSFSDLFDVLVNEGGSDADIYALLTSDSAVFSSEMTLAQLGNLDVYLDEDFGGRVLSDSNDLDTGFETVGTDTDDTASDTPTSRDPPISDPPTVGGGPPSFVSGGTLFESGLAGGSGGGSPQAVGVLPDPPKVGDPVTAVSILGGYLHFYDGVDGNNNPLNDIPVGLGITMPGLDYGIGGFEEGQYEYMPENLAGYRITQAEADIMNNVLGNSGLPGIANRAALVNDPAWKIVDELGNIFLINYFTGHYVYTLNTAFNQGENGYGNQIWFDYTITNPDLTQHSGQIFFEVEDDAPTQQDLVNIFNPGDGGLQSFNYFKLNEISAIQPDATENEHIDTFIDPVEVAAGANDMFGNYVTLPGTISEGDYIEVYFGGAGALADGVYYNGSTLTVTGSLEDLFNEVADLLGEDPVISAQNGWPLGLDFFAEFGTRDYYADNFIISVLSPVGQENIEAENAYYNLLNRYIDLPDTIGQDDALAVFYGGNGVLPDGVYIGSTTPVALELKGDASALDELFSDLVDFLDLDPNYYIGDQNTPGQPIFFNLFEIFGSTPQLIDIDTIWGADGRPENIIDNVVLTSIQNVTLENDNQTTATVSSYGAFFESLPTTTLTATLIDPSMIADHLDIVISQINNITADVSLFGEVGDPGNGVGNNAFVLSDFDTVVHLVNGQLTEQTLENKLIIDRETGRFAMDLNRGYMNEGEGINIVYTYTIGDNDGTGVSSTFDVVIEDTTIQEFSTHIPEQFFDGGFMPTDGLSSNIFAGEFAQVDFGLDGFGAIQVMSAADVALFDKANDIPVDAGFVYHFGDAVGSVDISGVSGVFTFYANEPGRDFGDFDYVLNPGETRTSDEIWVRVFDGDGSASNWSNPSLYDTTSVLEATVINFGASAFTDFAAVGNGLTDSLFDLSVIAGDPGIGGYTIPAYDVGWINQNGTAGSSLQTVLIYDDGGLIHHQADLIEFGREHEFESNFAFMLAQDSTGGGILDSADTNFGNFGLWFDANGNGTINTGEVSTLGTLSIDLNSFVASSTQSAGGNEITGAGTVSDGAGPGTFTQVNFEIVAPVLDPVFLDLDGDGHVALISAADSAVTIGALSSTDDSSQVGWMGEGTGVLVYDPHSLGEVVSLDQISFVDYLPGAETDLEGLKAFDTNGNGLLDHTDAEYASFHVWEDANVDGIVDENEMLSLADYSIVSIDLNSDQNAHSNAGNTVHGLSSYETADGEGGVVADVSLAILPEGGSAAPIHPGEVISQSDPILELDNLGDGAQGAAAATGSATLSITESVPAGAAPAGDTAVISPEQLQAIQAQA